MHEGKLADRRYRLAVQDARPADRHREAHGLPDPLVEPGQVVLAQLADYLLRVEPGLPQALVGVDVADPGHHRLVEQRRLQPPAPPALQPLAEGLEGEIGREQVRSQGKLFDITHQIGGRQEPDAGEVSDIGEPELDARREVEPQRGGFVRQRRVVGRDRMASSEAGDRFPPGDELAGQLEVDHGGERLEDEPEVLAPSPDLEQPAAGEKLEAEPGEGLDQPGTVQLEAGHRPAG
ncbi:hypothetical protein HRbin26_01948 [bacterium HR26]|nr:hypothetical protein HRbin26_01948 [bacterium HR26]